MKQMIISTDIISIIVPVLVAMSAMFNAVMDIVDHKFEKSIFSKCKNREWWDAKVSHLNKYIDKDPSKGRRKITFNIKIKGKSITLFKFNYPVQLTDAWHFFKMLSVISIISAIPLSHYIVYDFDILVYLYMVCILGMIWNITFSFFYHHILMK